MAGDKFSALWVSHTSINDFLLCPRLYFLKNVYKKSENGHKIKLTAPSLALGQAVHEVIESLSIIPSDKRFDQPLNTKFETSWKKVSGKKGGFMNPDIEMLYRERGRLMLERITKNPGPLVNKAVKIKMDLPYYWLAEDHNVILCGKIDWLEYVPETDSVHIIDFKTSKKDERDDSLQLPIYHLLVKNCQKRQATRASYWYIERMDSLSEKSLPDLEQSREKIMKIALQMKTMKSLGKLLCPHSGCFACEPYEQILKGEAEFVGEDEFGRDTYVLSDEKKIEDMSEIL